jgi:hypothetical protein
MKNGNNETCEKMKNDERMCGRMYGKMSERDGRIIGAERTERVSEYLRKG